MHVKTTHPFLQCTNSKCKTQILQDIQDSSRIIIFKARKLQEAGHVVGNYTLTDIESGGWLELCLTDGGDGGSTKARVIKVACTPTPPSPIDSA